MTSEKFCRIEKQLTLSGGEFLLSVAHKTKEGYVMMGEKKVYKKQCIACGFTWWQKPRRVYMERLEPFSIY